MFAHRIARRPRFTLLTVVAFVIVAAVLGAPVAGALESSGGFVAPGADSQLAVERVAAASGTAAGAEVVLLVDDRCPGKLAEVQRRLARLSGVARTDRLGSAAGQALLSATLAAGADREAVAQAALDAFAGRNGVTVGGPAVADVQIGEAVKADLGRAELLALPILLLLSLLFFRGRAR